MKVIVALCGYRPIERLTHWCVSQLLRCPEPEFQETAMKPIAGPDVYRSLAATLFLKSEEFDAILFVDDDVIFDPRDIQKLSQHIKDGKDIVGACYATKGDDPQIASRFYDGQTIEFNEQAKPVEIMYLNGGCIMASRKVFEKLSNKLDFCNSKEKTGFYPFFMPYVKRNSNGLFKKYTEYLTEDFAFCDRAKDSGFKIWLDPSIRLAHIGDKIFRLESIFQTKEENMDNIKLTKTTVV